LILGNLGFPGTLNFIGELFSIVSLGNIDYSLVALLLLNILLTSSYCFFTMSIVYLVGQAQIIEWYKDTNRMECNLMFLLFGILFISMMWITYELIADINQLNHWIKPIHDLNDDDIITVWVNLIKYRNDTFIFLWNV